MRAAPRGWKGGRQCLVAKQVFFDLEGVLDDQVHSGGGVRGHRPSELPVKTMGMPPRPSTVDLAVCAWFVAAIVLWIAVLLSPQGQTTYSATLGIGLAVLAFLSFGCWKIQSGKSCWRAFFTTLSLGSVVLVPFIVFGGSWDHLRQALGLVACMLLATAVVAAWVPESSRYFRAVAEHKRVRTAPAS